MRKVSLNLNEETPAVLRMRSVRKTDFFLPSTKNLGTINKLEKEGFVKSSKAKSTAFVAENRRISSSLERIKDITNIPQKNNNDAKNMGFRPYGMKRENERIREEERKVQFYIIKFNPNVTL